MENREEKHQQVLEQQLEEAKDPAAYETCDAHSSAEDPDIQLFTARRRGSMHAKADMPCQDYCITAESAGCTILAAADGVSSCERSDIGSRLACEAAVKTVKMTAGSCKDEEELVKRLLSVTFREKLTAAWISMIMEEMKTEHKTEHPETAAEQMEKFYKYASTLMFAVITENWYVVGNLGDGQVLVFNDTFGVKLRVHPPKESSKVRCLVNERCAREDFQVAKFARKDFNGILLSTDGIYESMEPGSHFYQYAVQMKKRFQEQETMQPYQPFCYKEEGEPYKDFSVMRTGDDCTIALALDLAEGKTDFQNMQNSLMEHTDAVLIRYANETCQSFFAKKEDQYVDVIVTEAVSEDRREDVTETRTEDTQKDATEVRTEEPQKDVTETENAEENVTETVKEDSKAESLTIRTAILEKKLESWSTDGYHFVCYPFIGTDTIAFLFQNGKLRRDWRDPEESSRSVLELYLKIRDLQEELQTLGYGLSESAAFLMHFDGENLYLKQEALERKTDAALPKSLRRCFESMIGVLESGEEKQPVFDIGYLNRGCKYKRFAEKSGELGQIVRENKELYLKNTGSCTWKLEDGTMVTPGEKAKLSEKFTFILVDEQGEELEHYQYTGREKL